MPGQLKVKVGTTYERATRGERGNDAGVVDPLPMNTAPATYPGGITMFAALAADGWPFDGIVTTFNLDGEGYQTLVGPSGWQYRVMDDTGAFGWGTWRAHGNIYQYTYNGTAWPASRPNVGSTPVWYFGGGTRPTTIMLNGDAWVSGV